MWGAIIAGVVALVGSLISGQQQKKNAERQAQANKDLAAFQADANEKYLSQQNEYNKPLNQMSRFQEAGLNPNLIYGQGSPGNQSQSLSYPDIKPADFQSRTNAQDTIATFNQTRLASAQVQAQNASTMQKVAQTSVARLQAQVLAKNPALDDAGFKAMIDNLVSSAQLKEQQVRGQKIANTQAAGIGPAAIEKVYKETQLLEQRFQLGNKDAAIKAEVLKSKEFQNAILEVQKKFMTDGDITPQHIMQFIQLLLMKAL